MQLPHLLALLPPDVRQGLLLSQMLRASEDTRRPPTVQELRAIRGRRRRRRRLRDLAKLSRRRNRA